MMSSLLRTAADTVVETAKETISKSKIVKIAAGVGGGIALFGAGVLVGKKTKGSKAVAEEEVEEEAEEVAEEKATKKKAS